MSTHTLALHTAATPYAVTVAHSALDKPFDTVSFTTQATLLLGTIAHIDPVEVTSRTDSVVPTSEEASDKLGSMSPSRAETRPSSPPTSDTSTTDVDRALPAARTGTLNTP